MGLVLTLEFKNGERTIEIDSDKNIEFLDYNVIHDLAAQEFGYPPTEESTFYENFKEDGFEVFLKHRWWLEAFVGVIIAHPGDVMEAGLSQEDTAKMLFRSTINDPDEQDYCDEVIDLVGEEKLVEWLAEAISSVLDERDGRIDQLADLIEPYITKEDIEVGENIWYEDGEPWENTKVGDYSVTIDSHEAAKWQIIVRYRIYDHVGFTGDVDADFTDEKANNTDSEMRKFLSRFDIELAEFTDPEPPDHPERDENGPFAVLYKLSADHFGTHSGEDENIVMRYKDIFDADNAMELSGYIFDRDGDSDYVEMAILRRLTPEELEARHLQEHEQEFLAHQGALFDAEEEPEDEREDWEYEWVLMTEEEVKNFKREEVKKKYGYYPSW
jgi:hypothetical protein